MKQSDTVKRFLTYIAMDTQSMDGADQIPSTEKQWDLARLLEQELKELGLSDAGVSSQCYVTATIPSNIKEADQKSVPVLGFIAHMDTAPACPGSGVNPKIWENYDGEALILNKELGMVLDPGQYPELLDYKGKTLITTDGTTLLGADDKAGVAEIMTMAAYFMSHPEVPHGTIKICFTPDEEVGRGADGFQVKEFGAEVAYTVDGGELGELEYENFNAASARITITGTGIHPGSAKGRMKNALLMAIELQSLLPVFENPMYTEGYEGFFHLDSMSGNVEEAVMDYIIRDHDKQLFLRKKEQMEQAVCFLNQKYGENTVHLELKDSYYNMKEQLADHMYLIDTAKEVMEELGITPKVTPIRGGTDGARLSYMGLPCPNLCTGGHNFHGRYEFICGEVMDQITELLITLAQRLTVK